MRRHIIIDTDENLIDVLREGYNIIEKTFYDGDTNKKAKELLNELVESEE